MGTRMSRGAARPADVFPVVAKVLLIAALVEFVLLRVVNRATGHLSPSFRELMGGLALAGITAYYVVLSLSALLILIAAWNRWRADFRLSVLLVAWTLITFGALIAGPSLMAFLLPASLAFGVMVVLVVRRLRSPLASDDVSRSASWARLLAFGSRAYPVMLLATYSMVFVLYWGRLAPSSIGGQDVGIAAYGVGEIFAISAAVLAPFYVPDRPRRNPFVLAVAAGGLVSLLWLGRPDILALVAFWSVGFQMYLAAPFYVAAAAALVYALAASFRNPKTGYLFHGLFLVALAGRMLNDVYTIHLALVGVLLLLTPRDYPMALPRSVARAPPLPGESGTAAHQSVEVRM